MQQGTIITTINQRQTFRIKNRGERCTRCLSKNCSFRLELGTKDNLQKLYSDNEHYDGYHRDQCVFDGSIEIEDMIRAEVRYSRGAVLNYGLVAFSPWRVPFLYWYRETSPKNTWSEV